MSYVVAEETIWLKNGNDFLRARAFSGGGRGSRYADVSSSSAESYDYRKKASFTPRHSGTKGDRVGDARKHVADRGGVIPPGAYSVGKTTKLPGYGSINLLSPYGRARHAHPALLYRRDSLLIHGPGVYGSDGCIVFASDHEKHRFQRRIDDINFDLVLFVILARTGVDSDRILREIARDYRGA